MNDLLTRKKHSKRISKLAYAKGLIDKKMYDSLYLEAYNIQRLTKRKNKYGSRFGRYYKELYYGYTEYYGEWLEYSIIDHVAEIIFWTLSEIDLKHGKILVPYKKLSTLNIIKFLNSITKEDRKNFVKIYDEKIESML